MNSGLEQEKTEITETDSLCLSVYSVGSCSNLLFPDWRKPGLNQKTKTNGKDRL
jgi:hypothetical protein